MYRDISYLIIKKIEKENLGIHFKSIISALQEQSVSVLFVDDTNLITDRKEVEARMQQIINMYNKLYIAIGGRIKSTKTKYYS